MDEQIRKRIEAVRREISGCALNPEHKDNLQVHLDRAERCANGTPDKIGAIGEAVAEMIIRDVRHDVRTEDMIVQRVAKVVESAIGKHSRACRNTRRQLLVPRALRRSGPLGWLLELVFYAWQQSPLITIALLIYLHYSGALASLGKILTGGN